MNKTFDRKDVFSWSNAEDAKQYIGKDCYFAHSVGVLSEHIKTGVMGILKDIFNSNYDAVSCAFGDGTSTWGLCLPADKVKEVEEPKKYRPFRTTEEFSNVTGKRIGSILKFKYVDKDVRYYTRMYTGFHFLENGNIYIELGSEAYSLEQLYNYYEWLDEHGEWQPFGVEE